MRKYEAGDEVRCDDGTILSISVCKKIGDEISYAVKEKDCDSCLMTTDEIDQRVRRK